jgi:hypothetical protein
LEESTEPEVLSGKPTVFWEELGIHRTDGSLGKATVLGGAQNPQNRRFFRKAYSSGRNSESKEPTVLWESLQLWEEF